MISVKINDDDWRTRMFVLINANLEDGSYPFLNAGIRVIKYKEEGENVYIVECYVRKKDFPDIENAFYYSIERINEFLGNISIIINAPVLGKKLLSICPMRVPARDVFEMLVPADFSADTTPVAIKPSDLEGFPNMHDRVNYMEAIRQTANAINSDSSDEKFLLYFSAFERIAEVESTEKLYNECSQCGHKDERGIATANYIKEAMLRYGATNKEFKSIRSIRGKIAHGSGKRDNEFVVESRALLAKLESALLAELSKKIGVVIKMPFRASFGMPLWKCKGIKVTGRLGPIPPIFGLEDASFSIPVSFSKIDSEYTETPEGMLGTFGPEGSISKPEIHKECWPY